MKEFTATVTTGPLARCHAGMLPAMSTCDITHPPKIVPCALVSAGIGTMRSTGCSSGSFMIDMSPRMKSNELFGKLLEGLHGEVDGHEGGRLARARPALAGARHVRGLQSALRRGLQVIAVRGDH